MIKTTGKEFKSFYEDDSVWIYGMYHEDEVITVDGKQREEYETDLMQIADASTMTISGGYVTNKNDDELGSLEGLFKKWKKKQTTAFLCVEIDLKKLEDLKVAVKNAGGKIA